MAALASLTANYTDSEEEDRDEEQDEDRAARDKPVLPAAVDRLREGSAGTPGSNPGSNSASARSTPTKKTRLVSYVEEGDHVKDDEDEDRPGGPERRASDSDADVVSMELDSDDAGLDGEARTAGKSDKEDAEDADKDEAAPANERRLRKDSLTGVEVEAWSDGVKLPPEPPGMCNPKLQERINELYRRKRETGYDMNAVIQRKKAFRNPSIYEKLIQFCEIDETGTNFPKELYDGHLFGKESYYDELSKVQAADMERREKAAKSRQQRQEVAAAAHHHHHDKSAAAGGKRRSKWDQGAPSAAAVAALPPTRAPTTGAVPLPSKPAPQVVSASVPAPQVVSAGAASSKTISAFGPLKK